MPAGPIRVIVVIVVNPRSVFATLMGTGVSTHILCPASAAR